jgi:glycine/D-amino acid oxidase-like deaminating enzyme/nitrite reductase/ring-hydroxylating ferredoxin subunit
MIESQSPWKSTGFPRFPKLTKNIDCDVLVVGGGITGLTAAYLLKKAGQRVCLLERDRLAHGDTGVTTAHLTCVTDMRLSEMARTFGKESARLVWEGGAAATNTIEQIASRESIDCELRRIPGFLHGSLESDKDESKDLKRESELAEELGFSATFMPEVSVVHKPGYRVANQAKFEPLRYLAGLAKLIPGDGSAIYENSEATEFETEPHAAKVNGKQVRCNYIIIATHVPLMGKTGIVSATLFQTKIYPYSSYVVGARLPAGAVPEASYWDTTDPYYYLRIDRHAKHDYAIFGGKDHKTGQAKDPKRRFAELADLLRELIPSANVDRHWSGQVVETNDGLPYIGETAERQFVATGFSGNGMTFGTLAAMMACDAVLGRENPWQDLLSVNRKKVRGGTWNYITENFSYPYYLLRDHLKGSEARSPDEVKRGDGKVLKLDGKQVACSRDSKGKLTTVSAVCTHMGCLVHWNNAEKTWDCPCHGSRFATSGNVLAGPAETPLEKIEATEAEDSKQKSNGQKKKQPRPRSAAAGKDR